MFGAEEKFLRLLLKNISSLLFTVCQGGLRFSRDVGEGGATEGSERDMAGNDKEICVKWESVGDKKIRGLHFDELAGMRLGAIRAEHKLGLNIAQVRAKIGLSPSLGAW